MRTGIGRRPWYAAAIVAMTMGLGALAACNGEEKDSTPTPRAVVLVTIDTLRADSLPMRPGASPATPFLDTMAEEGVVYERAYAPSSWTVPSMASLFTSIEPWSHGVNTGLIRRPKQGGDVGVQNQPILPASYLTLAETFRKAGYRTVGIASNQHLGARQGFKQGFDFYTDEAHFRNAPWVNDEVKRQLELACGSDWKETWKDEKVFLWIHYFDPHVPYFARLPWITEEAPEFETDPSKFPAAWDQPRLKKEFPREMEEAHARVMPLYYSEVSYVDDHLRMLDDEVGFKDDNVLFVLTSDHGEEFVEHGRFGHAQTLFEEGIAVPLLVYWPDVIEGGRRLDDFANIMDIYPTMTELLGLKAPAGLHGSRLPGIFDGDAPRTAPIYFHTGHTPPEKDAVREGPWKLIRRHEKPLLLYNMDEDPGETVSVADQHPEIVERLVDLLDKHIAALPPPPDDSGSVEVTQEEADRLGDMGYAEGDED